MKTSVLAVAFSLVSASPAWTQTTCNATGIPSSCTTSNTLQITTQTTARVTVTPTSFNFGNPTANDYNQGFTQALGHAVQVKVNNSWTLSISSSQATWTATGGASPTKPRSDLQFATSSGGPYTAMPGAATSLATGTATASTTVNVWYRVLWSWTLDIPGTYALPVVLLISAP